MDTIGWNIYLVSHREQAPPMPADWYAKHNSLTSMLTAKNVCRCNIRGESQTALSGFKTMRRRHQKSKAGVSVAQEKGLMPCKN